MVFLRERWAERGACRRLQSQLSGVWGSTGTQVVNQGSVNFTDTFRMYFQRPCRGAFTLWERFWLLRACPSYWKHLKWVLCLSPACGLSNMTEWGMKELVRKLVHLRLWEWVEENNVRWYCHVTRLEECGYTLRNREDNVLWSVTREWLGERWMAGVNEALRFRNIDIIQVSLCVSDGTRCRRLYEVK